MTVFIIKLRANLKVVFFSPFQSYFLHANLKVVQKNSGSIEIITVEQLKTARSFIVRSIKMLDN